jgi:DNA-binding NtrC family response regulator
MEARRILQEQIVDVVLIGLNDYGTESLSIIRCLRESSDDAAFILLTKLQDMRLSIEGMKLGAFDALPVPVDVDLLLERIFDACFGRRKAPERRLTIVGKIDGRRPKSLRSFMDAVGLKKARAWLGTARLS